MTDISQDFLAVGSKNHKEYVALMECVSGEGQYWSNNRAVGAITWPIVKFWSNIWGKLDKNELKTGNAL